MTHVLLLEPYLTGSHRAWATGYRSASALDVTILGLPGRFWKWRMHGAAVTLARRVRTSGIVPDVVLATDMLDLATFLGLARDRLAGVPAVLYMHENQLAYPTPELEDDWSASRRRRAERQDAHYAFVNLTSALAADLVLWNSDHNRRTFLDGLPGFLRAFPDRREPGAVRTVATRSRVLPLGLDLPGLDAVRPARRRPGPPRIVWNHRWEHDKDPDTFARALAALAARGRSFELILLGETFVRPHPALAAIRDRFADRIAHDGFARDRAAYGRRLWQGDVVVSTARHEFFGAGVAEAVHCRCWPVLPNRLAYPELVPHAYRRPVLYDDLDGLVDRLDAALEGVDRDDRAILAESMGEFDWRRVAPRYDAALVEAVAAAACRRRS